MIERVARALCREIWRDPDDIEGGFCPAGTELDPGEMAWTGFSDAARAAIAALREPTDEMTGACDNGGAYWGKCPTCGGAENTWRVMIDAALK